MAEEKTKTLEREYIIPLRRHWLLVPAYRRAGRAAKAVKKFIAKHMKVAERDTDNVKLDMYLNNELWYLGKTNPPSRIKVKATKDGEIVRVELVEVSEQVKFLKARHAKIHKGSETKESKKSEEKKFNEQPSAEEKKEISEKKLEEKEKGKAVEQEQMKEAKKEKLTDKHVTKVKEAEIKRTALNRH